MYRDTEEGKTIADKSFSNWLSRLKEFTIDHEVFEQILDEEGLSTILNLTPEQFFEQYGNRLWVRK
jgi:hypothetical protein